MSGQSNLISPRAKAIHEIAVEMREVGDRHGGLPDGTSKQFSNIVVQMREAVTKKLMAGQLTWTDLMTEEAFGAAAETSPKHLSKSLARLAAICACWIADIESRESQKGDKKQ